MRQFIFFALAVATAGAWAGLATGDTNERALPSGHSSIAAIADESTSWAEFSSRVPNLSELRAANAEVVPE
jgi:hypothetical protein